MIITLLFLLLSSYAYGLRIVRRQSNITFSDFFDEDRTSRKLSIATSHTQHRVDKLPGLFPSNLVHYAGHILVDPENGGHLFYWLFETEVNPEEGTISSIINCFVTDLIKYHQLH